MKAPVRLGWVAWEGTSPTCCIETCLFLNFGWGFDLFRAVPNRTEPFRTVPNRTEPFRTGPNRAGWDQYRLEFGWVGFACTGKWGSLQRFQALRIYMLC